MIISSTPVFLSVWRPVAQPLRYVGCVCMTRVAVRCPVSGDGAAVVYTGRTYSYHMQDVSYDVPLVQISRGDFGGCTAKV